MRAAILLSMIFIAPMGHAQQVYKCVKGREVSYQSAPCDDTQRIAKQWDATPEPEPSADELRMRDARRQRDEAGSAQPRRATGTRRVRSGSSRNYSSINIGDARCDAAKARREAKLKSVGLKRTFDLLRKLDDAVYDACK